MGLHSGGCDKLLQRPASREPTTTCWKFFRDGAIIDFSIFGHAKVG